MKKSITLLYALLLTVLGATQVHADYYLVGESFGWTAPNDYKFTVNPSNSNEYVVTAITLVPGDQIKVTNPETNQWYPSGANYVVPEQYAGEVSIYFSPDYRSDWDQFGGYFWIEVLENKFIVNTVNLAGSWAGSEAWQPNLDAYSLTEVSDGIWDFTYKDLPAGYSEFKFTVNHSWEVNFGGTFSVFGTATDAYRGGSNIGFTTTEVADVNFRLDLTNYDPDTKLGAKFTVSIPMDLELVDNDTEGDNLSIIEACDGELTNITLKDRTLFKDGYWNTLCLPFDVDLTDTESPLYGADVEKLAEASIEGTTLYLTFQQVTDKVKAGVPYIVKWAAASDITDPEFKNVIIKNTLVPAVFGNVSFVGSFTNSELAGNDKSNLYMGDGNELHWPIADYALGAFRAYIHIDNQATAKSINKVVTEFNADPTSITLTTAPRTTSDAWYTLSGQRLSSKPAKAGIYIVGGQKVIIK